MTKEQDWEQNEIFSDRQSSLNMKQKKYYVTKVQKDHPEVIFTRWRIQ